MGSYAGVMVGGTMRLWREMNRVYFGMVRKKNMFEMLNSCSICFFELEIRQHFAFETTRVTKHSWLQIQ